MKLNIIITIIICVLSHINIVAQRERTESPSNGGMITGKVVDASNQTPIEYANIAIYSSKDSILISGGITDEQGRFRVSELKPDLYYATFKYIGYNTTTKYDLKITAANRSVKAGIIELEVSAHNLNELSVVADKQQVLYKIDKKVVNPSQFMAAQGGSAVDILANVPSVSVDIEGNVTMRGSSNFMVLINGKPTPFDASDALDQIPASSIENIEIITNPSAKYDPDGAAGILNIITKKESLRGWNGIVNASANTRGSYSGDALFNFTGEKTRWYIGANRNNRLRQADYTSESGTIETDATSLTFGDTTHISNVGDRDMEFYSNSIKTGLDYDINSKNTIGIELQGGNNGRIFENTLKTEEWITNQASLYSMSTTKTEALGQFASITLNQQSQFGDDKSHTLISSVNIRGEKGNDNTLSTKEQIETSNITGQQTWEDSKEKFLQIKTDYTRPWRKGKMEAGYQLRLDDEWSNYDASFDTDTITDNSIFYNESTFYRLINSVYGTFSGEAGQFGYQLGLRTEHTLRTIEQYNTTEKSEIDRLDFYPSAHFSYNMLNDQSFMTSYTRRIDRPRSHWLDPYVSWQDPNNVKQGNPDLDPQYINSYEVSYQKRFESNFVSVELFHRNVLNKIERVQGRYDDGVILNSFENVGQDYSTGIEFMLSYNITEWWSTNLSGSLYDYRLSVNEEFENSINETQSNNWSARMSNTFKPTQNFRIQLDGRYRSASITATGSRDGMFFTSLAAKQSLFNNKMDIGVSVLDLLNTAKMNSTSNSDTFYSNYSFDMKSPTFQFSISYKFNNYKADRSQRGDAAGGSMDMEY